MNRPEFLKMKGLKRYYQKVFIAEKICGKWLITGW